MYILSIFELRRVIHFSKIAADLERNVKIKHTAIYNQLHVISISNKLLELRCPHDHYLDFQNKTYEIDIFNSYTYLIPYHRV